MKTKISARKFLSKYMIYLAFVALLIVFSLTLRNVGNGFLDMGNVWNIIRQTALIAILGVGMTYALGAGQIDLSVGSVVGLTSLVTAWTVQAAGLIPGVLARSGRRRCRRRDQWCAHRMGKNPALYRYARHADPLCRCFTHGLRSEICPHHEHDVQLCVRRRRLRRRSCAASLDGRDRGRRPALPAQAPFGRQVISVGGNPKAALYSGVRVKLTIFKVMLLSGVLASLAGILWAGRFGGGRYSLGEAEETSAIAATVLGGHEHQRRQGLRGGRLRRRRHARHDQQRARQYGLDVYQQMVVRGLIILAAVAFTVNAEKDT